MAAKGDASRVPARRLRALLGALQPQTPNEHAATHKVGTAAEGSLLPYPEHDWTVAPDPAIISDQDATPDQIASWHRDGSAPAAPHPPHHPTPHSIMHCSSLMARCHALMGSGTS